MAVAEPNRTPAEAGRTRIPTVIAEDLHIVYRVYGARAARAAPPPR